AASAAASRRRGGGRQCREDIPIIGISSRGIARTAGRLTYRTTPSTPPRAGRERRIGDRSAESRASAPGESPNVRGQRAAFVRALRSDLVRRTAAAVPAFVEAAWAV